MIELLSGVLSMYNRDNIRVGMDMIMNGLWDDDSIR